MASSHETAFCTHKRIETLDRRTREACSLPWQRWRILTNWVHLGCEERERDSWADGGGLTGSCPTSRPQIYKFECMRRGLQFAALVVLALFLRSEENHKEEITMASNFVANVDDSKEGQREYRHQHQHHQAPSPRAVRRSWSTNSSTCGDGAGSIPKCVCAPATHAGSFKCRLHRTTSHGHSPTSPTSMPPPPPPANSSSTHTVEAQ